MSENYKVDKSASWAVEQLNSVANKTEKIRIDITGTDGSYQFRQGSKVLNFKELNDLLQNSPNFCVFVHGNREHRCTFIDLSSNPKQMRFVAPLLNDGTLKTQSFYVTSNDGVAMTSITSSNINSENQSNKRTDLSNPNNTTYPTTKAVSDAVSNVNEKLSELEEKTPQLVGANIVYEHGHYYYTEYNQIYKRYNDATCKCAEIDCEAGDMFIINGKARKDDKWGNVWAVADEAGKIISRSTKIDDYVRDCYLVIPQGGKKLLLSSAERSSYSVKINFKELYPSAMLDNSNLGLKYYQCTYNAGKYYSAMDTIQSHPDHTCGEIDLRNLQDKYIVFKGRKTNLALYAKKDGVRYDFKYIEKYGYCFILIDFDYLQFSYSASNVESVVFFNSGIIDSCIKDNEADFLNGVFKEFLIVGTPYESVKVHTLWKNFDGNGNIYFSFKVIENGVEKEILVASKKIYFMDNTAIYSVKKDGRVWLFVADLSKLDDGQNDFGNPYMPETIYMASRNPICYEHYKSNDFVETFTLQSALDKNAGYYDTDGTFRSTGSFTTAKIRVYEGDIVSLSGATQTGLMHFFNNGVWVRLILDWRLPNRESIYIPSGVTHLYVCARSSENISIVVKTQNIVKNIRGTMSIIGDSLSTFSGYITPVNNVCYYPPIAGNEGYLSGNDIDSVQKTWWFKLAKENGIVINSNASYSGSCVCNTGFNETKNAHSFVKRINDVEQADIIVIAGGINDAANNSPLGEYKYDNITEQDLASFRPACAYLINNLQGKMKVGTRIIWLLPEIKDEYAESVKTVCSHYDVEVISVTRLSAQELDNSSHPNSYGADYIKKTLVSCL